MSIGISLLLADVVMPISIPFLDSIVFGFLLNFTSIRAVLKATMLTSLILGLKTGIGWGIGGFLFIFALYFVGSLIFMPTSYYLFKKYKIRERIGY